MLCKKCKCKSIVKNGFMKGKQRYKCRSCGYNFTDTPPRKTSLEIRKQALQLYLE
jgi:transposase-like protein